MLQERPNEPNQWQNRLSELDSLGGEPALDKTAAWNRLHNRLTKKPANRKPLWYLLAAASLIAVVLLPLLFTSKQEVPTVSEKKSTPTNQLPITVSLDSVTGPKDQLVKNPDVQAKTMENSVVWEKTAVVRTKQKAQKHIPDQRDSLEIATIELPELPANIIQPVDTSFLVAVSPLVADKKLKLVHINEVEPPPSKEPSYATLKLNTSLQEQSKIKNSRKSRSSNLSMGKNASDNLVRIQLSPSN